MADRELGIRISKRSASGGVGGGRHGKFKDKYSTQPRQIQWLREK